MHHPTDRITHTTAFVTPVVEHWREREIAQWVCLVKGVAHMCESVQLANKITISGCRYILQKVFIIIKQPVWTSHTGGSVMLAT